MLSDIEIDWRANVNSLAYTHVSIEAMSVNDRWENNKNNTNDGLEYCEDIVLKIFERSWSISIQL